MSKTEPEKELAVPPTDSVPWSAKPTGEYYEHEVGDWLPKDVMDRRANGCVVYAQTAFFARQLGSTRLMLAPEHVDLRLQEDEQPPKRAIPMKRKPQKCSNAGCRKEATHVADDGTFQFYLCADCARTAKQPPLNAKEVMPLAPRTDERLTAAQFKFLREAAQATENGSNIGAVGRYKPAQRLIELGFLGPAKSTGLSQSPDGYNRLVLTDAGKAWLSKHAKE